MAEYDNSNRGALFVNDRKESDKHPDYRGTAEVEGVECWVSCWIKTSSKGAKYLSLAFTPKEEQASSAPRRTATNNDAADFLAQNQGKANAHKQGPNNLSGPSRPNQPADFDDDIPF